MLKNSCLRAAVFVITILIFNELTNHTADYSAGNNSQVTIAPLGAATVDLNFISFDVEDFPDASCHFCSKLQPESI